VPLFTKLTHVWIFGVFVVVFLVVLHSFLLQLLLRV